MKERKKNQHFPSFSFFFLFFSFASLFFFFLHYCCFYPLLVCICSKVNTFIAHAHQRRNWERDLECFLLHLQNCSWPRMNLYRPGSTGESLSITVFDTHSVHNQHTPQAQHSYRLQMQKSQKASLHKRAVLLKANPVTTPSSISVYVCVSQFMFI